MPYGDGIDVILGGGRREFMPIEADDPEYPSRPGLRDDGRNLLKSGWPQIANGGTRGGARVRRLDDFSGSGRGPTHGAF